VLAKLGN